MKKRKILKGLSAFALTTMASVGLANAATMTASSCTSDGGTVKTNFYILIDANTYHHLTNVTKPWVYETSKDFSEGLDSDLVISKNQVDVTDTVGTEAYSTDIEEWTIGNVYKAYQDAKSNNNKKVNGNSAYYASSKWYNSSGTAQTSESSLPTTLSDFSAKTLFPTTEFTKFLIADEAINTGVTRTYTESLISGINATTLGIDESNSSTTYFFAPAVYYVQYCDGATTGDDSTAEEDSDDESTETNTNTNTNTNSNSSTTSEGYTITYDANGGANAPSKYVSSDNSATTISTSTPTLAGNKFLGWSTDSKATEPDSNYAPGKTYSAAKDITLYAVWQTKTGVADYTIAAGLVGAAAIGGLVIAKRKNAIRQI